MSDAQIFVGIGLTLALAIGCQVVANRHQWPAIILLLPVGFIAGVVTTHGVPEQPPRSGHRTVGGSGRDAGPGVVPRLVLFVRPIIAVRTGGPAARVAEDGSAHATAAGNAPT